MESKRILNELKAEYEKYASMVIESKENLRMLRENKEMTIRRENEFDIIALQMGFRSENQQKLQFKQQLLDSYNQHKQKKDLSPEQLKALRGGYKQFHETYVNILKIQKQLIVQKEKTQKQNLKETIDRIMEKHEINEKLLSLTNKRNRAKLALDAHKERTAAEKGAKRISKAAMEAPMNDVCAICYDTHATKDTMLTSCKHQYGTQCYIQFIHNCVNNVRDICCPLCKKSNPLLTIFREKAAPIRKPKGTPVRGKGAIGDAVYLLELSKVRSQLEV